MKDYSVYLWLAFTVTFAILLVHLAVSVLQSRILIGRLQRRIKYELLTHKIHFNSQVNGTVNDKARF